MSTSRDIRRYGKAVVVKQRLEPRSAGYHRLVLIILLILLDHAEHLTADVGRVNGKILNHLHASLPLQ